jgi:hypothetical protein
VRPRYMKSSRQSSVVGQKLPAKRLSTQQS